MTREEAIKQLEWLKSAFGGTDDWIFDVMALNMAITALKAESCEDAVSREAVLEVVNNPLNIRLDKIIEALPLVTPKPRAGKWIPTQHFDEWYGPTGECSNCGIEHILGLPYCPCCGAKMEGESE